MDFYVFWAAFLTGFCGSEGLLLESLATILLQLDGKLLQSLAKRMACYDDLRFQAPPTVILFFLCECCFWCFFVMFGVCLMLFVFFGGT